MTFLSIKHYTTQKQWPIWQDNIRTKINKTHKLNPPPVVGKKRFSLINLLTGIGGCINWNGRLWFLGKALESAKQWTFTTLGIKTDAEIGSHRESKIIWWSKWLLKLKALGAAAAAKLHTRRKTVACASHIMKLFWNKIGLRLE